MFVHLEEAASEVSRLLAQPSSKQDTAVGRRRGAVYSHHLGVWPQGQVGDLPGSNRIQENGLGLACAVVMNVGEIVAEERVERRQVGVRHGSEAGGVGRPDLSFSNGVGRERVRRSASR